MNPILGRPISHQRTSMIICMMLAVVAALPFCAPVSHADDPPAPKTVIVMPEGDAIVEREESTFDFSGTAVATGSAVAAVEWRNNAGAWQTATGTDHWSFTATDLVVGANIIQVRSRNTQETNSPVQSRTITRKPMWGITCDDPTEIIEDGFYAYDLTVFPRAWHRFTAPTDGLVTVASTNRLGKGGICTGDSQPCGETFHSRTMPAPKRFIIYEGNTVLFCSSRDGNESRVGGFSFAFEPADVQPQNNCMEAMEITGPGSYHFTMGRTLSSPCLTPLPELGKGYYYYTTWYRFTAPQDGVYEFSLRQNSPIPSESEFRLVQISAKFHVFPGDSCPLSCSDRLDWESSSITGATLAATQGSTYYITLTNTDEFHTPGYGILDVALGPTPPQGEVCSEAIELSGSGIYEFSNWDALLGDPCRPGSRTQWFTFTAPDNGTVLVETCGLTSFDTFVSAFAGNCPANCATRIAYNDDSAGPCGLQSRLQFPVQAGQTYKIALSGFGTERGSGEFLFDFSAGDAPHLVGDIVVDDHVNVADVTALANLIANGTPPPIHLADINGDGTVNELDVQALAEMIVDGTE